MGKRSNGEGSVRWNATRGRYEGRVTVAYVDGIQQRRMVTGRTKGDVLRRMRELAAATEAGESPAARDLTIASFLTTWIDDVLPGTVARTTEDSYRYIVDHYLVPKLGRKRLVSLTARDVALMLRALEADGLSPNTRRLARSVLRRAIRYAEQEGMVARNVAAIADGVKVPAPEGRAMTAEQARQLLTHLQGHRLEAPVTVAMLGLRRGELLGLTWDDLDLDATPARLTVRRALKRIRGIGLVVEEPKTRQSRRTIHVPAPVVEVLRRHRQRQVTERLAAGSAWTAEPLGYDFIFRTEGGEQLDPDNFRNALYRATEAAGIGRWSPHALRHSSATLMLAAGVPLEVISEVLGHSSIRVTSDIYAHLQEPAKTIASDALGATLWGAS